MACSKASDILKFQSATGSWSVSLMSSVLSTSVKGGDRVCCPTQELKPPHPDLPSQPNLPQRLRQVSRFKFTSLLFFFFLLFFSLPYLPSLYTFSLS
eukprot:m.107781 g.107781  ORF g.107781 m.107781 type:complete len:97 (+) comp22597_c1_seq2:2262-2552(+)